jgi:hypothetical protein
MSVDRGVIERIGRRARGQSGQNARSKCVKGRETKKAGEKKGTGIASDPHWLFRSRSRFVI